MTRNELLIDVRTPAEFATGALSSDLCTAVNIEYQIIHQLPQIYSALGVDVQKMDDITLYCRSGRRSNIALHALKELGYANVRDIGGFEEARAVLKREEMARSLKKANTSTIVETEMDVAKVEDGNKRKEARAKSFGTLLDGLKASG